MRTLSPDFVSNIGPAHSTLQAAVRIDFACRLQPWDGFGFNYVEACQTRDFGTSPQDYGGFSILSESARREIIELVFGDEGLRPGVVKMFLDCWHQREPGPDYDFNSRQIAVGAYDHRSTTALMRAFVRGGAAYARQRKEELQVITTLYGPPAWMTQQKFVRGRDLNPRFRQELAKYCAAWVSFLRQDEGLRVCAASLHNEGEDWLRWPDDGSTAGDLGHDYNLYWPVSQTVDMMSLTREVFDANGLADVWITPGETTNWKRFHTWGYARALVTDPRALDALGLITSHGFYGPGQGRWSADHRSAGVDLLREHKPGLHAWTTSTGWGKQFLSMTWEIEQSLYAAKLNAYIPWAGVQRHELWSGGDPNPNTAIRVEEDGTYSVQKEYYVYKHACRAGQPGMAVADFSCNDSEVLVLAFAANGSRHRDAFVLANIGDTARAVQVEVRGASGTGAFRAWRTTETENWTALPDANFPGDLVLPARSVTTFFCLAGVTA